MTILWSSNKRKKIIYDYIIIKYYAIEKPTQIRSKKKITVFFFFRAVTKKYLSCMRVYEYFLYTYKLLIGNVS